MFDVPADFTSRPECYSVLTSETLWTDPHISEQMLSFHLDSGSALASRPPDQIDAAVAWLDTRVSLRGKRVTDLGCGPGLYTERFHDSGAIVTGLDWSACSLAHAKSRALATRRQISYSLADYTQDPLPTGTDLFTLIYYDFCALSPAQRHALLLRIREALATGGLLAMDVYAMPAFERFDETVMIEYGLMNGFWSANEYIGAKKSFKYVDERATLERYLIVEEDRYWSVFNWLQYFSVSSLTEELERAGFEVAELAPGFTDDQLHAECFVVLARTRT